MKVCVTNKEYEALEHYVVFNQSRTDLPEKLKLKCNGTGITIPTNVFRDIIWLLNGREHSFSEVWINCGDEADKTMLLLLLFGMDGIKHLLMKFGPKANFAPIFFEYKWTKGECTIRHKKGLDDEYIVSDIISSLIYVLNTLIAHGEGGKIDEFIETLIVM